MNTRDDLAAKFCKGYGVEIGPGMLPTKVPSGSSLCFVDKRSTEELRTYFSVDDGVTVTARLADFSQASFDFLIAHHVLEHCSNVIEELVAWISYLKDDAILLLSVPIAHCCPDKARLVTPQTHFLMDYIMRTTDTAFESREHIYSFLWGWYDQGGLAGRDKQEAQAMVHQAVHAPVNDLHWHVFSAQTFRFVVEIAAKLALRNCQILYQDNGILGLEEHRIVVRLVKAESIEGDVGRLKVLRDELAPLITRISLESLEGQKVYCLSEQDAGKVFIAENGRCRWVREPEILDVRGLTNAPAAYLEVAPFGEDAYGPDIANAIYDRTSAIKQRVRKDGRGLEISPGNSPLIHKDEGNVTYCDKVNDETWIDNYKGYHQERLRIDIVLGDGLLCEYFSPESFDYIVSSHVLEHIPDFIQFFLSVEKILAPDGDLVMLVPDKRYTFDALQDISSVVDIEDAYKCKLRGPSPTMVRKWYSRVDQKADAVALWNGTYNPKPMHNEQEVEKILQEVDYSKIDVHCWMFTPEGIRTLLEHVVRKFTKQLQIAEITEPRKGSNEFLVHMRKVY